MYDFYDAKTLKAMADKYSKSNEIVQKIINQAINSSVRGEYSTSYGEHDFWSSELPDSHKEAIQKLTELGYHCSHENNPDVHPDFYLYISWK